MAAQVEEMNLMDLAHRIREMREISGISISEMAEKTEVSVDQYLTYEAGETDIPFTFIHKCALTFNVGMSDLLEGQSARLSTCTVMRKGRLLDPIREDGIQIMNMAPMFRNKIAEPYWVKYEYSEELQNKPIHTTQHSGQEFDYIMSGRLKVQVGDTVEYLSEGDSIFYNSSLPHGMIAVGGQDCTFLAFVMPGSGEKETVIRNTLITERAPKEQLVSDAFIETTEDENGLLTDIRFKNSESFNFGFDVVDAIARKTPDKLAMLHISKDGTERRFTFRDMKRASNRAANYLKSLGIQKGDKVMLVLKRHYQFWHVIVALHKIGAIAIPATTQLQKHDFEYRFQAADVKAIVATCEDDVPHHVEEAEPSCPTLQLKILVGGEREGWHDYNAEIDQYSSHYYRKKAGLL